MGGQRSGRADGWTDGGSGEPGTPEPVQDARLLAAAARVLEDAGWQGLTIEAVAEAAGLSRVTAWRLGATREALVASLIGQLDQDYRRGVWAGVGGAGTPRGGGGCALGGPFGVLESPPPPLLGADTH